MERKFICIRCPEGCEITTTLDGHGNITDIKGNSCKLGIEYVKTEATDPRRTLTTTVKVDGGAHPLCPVWSEKPVPKDRILDVAAQLRKITLNAPVASGQVVLENVLGLGVNIVASCGILAVRGKINYQEGTHGKEKSTRG
jgi:CxxC motif-containing protein